ncbi:hypothetical protein K439DRAFT_1554161 [Ramaria rubella]|nr:hypothetical protein K439DRAFT_1554161 [Ramaria rubella]
MYVPMFGPSTLRLRFSNSEGDGTLDGLPHTFIRECTIETGRRGNPRVFDVSDCATVISQNIWSEYRGIKILGIVESGIVDIRRVYLLRTSKCSPTVFVSRIPVLVNSTESNWSLSSDYQKTGFTRSTIQVKATITVVVWYQRVKPPDTPRLAHLQSETPELFGMWGCNLSPTLGIQGYSCVYISRRCHDTVGRSVRMAATRAPTSRLVLFLSVSEAGDKANTTPLKD